MTVKVKPLVWRDYSNVSFTGSSGIGEYIVEIEHDDDASLWGMWSPGDDECSDPRSRHSSPEAAKAAAQADYEARILAAIEAPVQEPVAWLPTSTVKWLSEYDGPACATPTAAHNRPIKSDGGVPVYTTPPDALALVAAAYRDAADACDDYPRAAPEEAEWTHYDEQIAYSKDCILASTPADAQAALTAIERAAYERGKAEAQRLLAGSVKETINNALLDYRQTEVCDENGDGYPLVDALTLKGHSIDMGIREVESIADTVAGAILALLTQEGR